MFPGLHKVLTVQKMRGGEVVGGKGILIGVERRKEWRVSREVGRKER